MNHKDAPAMTDIHQQPYAGIDLDNLQETAIILDGLDDCIIGYSSEGLLIYSYAKFIDHFMGKACEGCKEHMSLEDATEWVDYNVMGVIGNGAGCIVMQVPFGQETQH